MCDECFALKSACALAARRLGRFSEGRDVARHTQYRQQEEELEKAVTDAHIAFNRHQDEAHQGQDFSGS
jgi:hypothetical protein